uniref:Uncharacterized protein n=2 Tax=Leptocylindrus danicus TaxID=163516 RepID=A0A7S2PBL0_9STRA|mmetsp:Transcript_28505/g.41942  ORF Transcript_28505/g.41942 Transcript_28505/m.41942 type:complete len:422 (+) Transcript_28505:170-1435(+)|eukprot:CAMPEP_0116030984 /NCGR_PEP_ID=MMETSP0321-20121206/17217_1 /TAXON_ID=163516 /ORGANISM="Leptocylindrus danicus var. danicus, Strain B650" /LENGTH=421 /DNA_ID=CAMNT_0003505969 /DNA_START=246 /DNA_END=1514 /DNA_ORIENTATION=+
MATEVTENQLSPFEDLLDNDNYLGCSDSDDEDDSTVINITPMEASCLSLSELQGELNKRGLRAKGFFDDDTKALQRVFDGEHKAYVETKRRESVQMRASQAQIAAFNAKTEKLRKQSVEENIEIEKDSFVKHWIEQIYNKTAPKFCSVKVNNITCRILAKALWESKGSSIVSLDLSGLNLGDTAGAFICRSLKMNKSIIKLDLSENNFGSKTLQCLSESLQCAKDCVIKSVSLASNPLHDTDNKQDFLAAINAFSSMLEANHSLTYFSIWQCGLGSTAADILLHGFEKNDSITCFEIGYNGFTIDQERNIVKRLRDNIEISDKKNEDARVLRSKQIEDENERREKENTIEQEKERENWLEQRKLLRAEEKRLSLEKSIENEKKLKKQQKEEADKLALQKLEAGQASKKKFKGKKKSRNKKK